MTEGTKVLESSERFNMGEKNVMMAFALEYFDGGVLELDERYVRWVVRTWEFVGQERTENFYPLHPCTDEEMSNFYPAENE